MAHHHEEARAAQLEVEISVYHGIAADFLLVLILLHRVLAERWEIVGRGVFSEKSRVSAEVAI